jgi:thiamine-phosphate pyrophosphorylase
MVAQLYYITDRSQFPGDAGEQERRLLAKIAESAAAGVDYIQLREKDLSMRALEEMAGKAMAALRGSRTKLLINSRTDVVLASGAQGVHLPANDLPASEVRAIFDRACGDRAHVARAVIGVSTHSLVDVASAESHGADFAVFGPVFGKGSTANSEGLEQLRRVCHRAHAASPPMPVFALGGITLDNAQQCIEAGAAGIAGIRLFQERDTREIIKELRAE